MKTTKRLLALLMVMTLLLPYLSPAAAAAEPAVSSASSAEDTVITLWTYPIGDWGSEEAVSELIAGFEEAHPGITVEVTRLTYTTGGTLLEEAIAAGTAPDLILEGPELVVANYGERGLMADLSDLLDETDRSEISPNALAAGYGSNGSLYQYPLAGTVHTMAINKTVFEAAGAMQYLDEETRTWNSTADFFAAVQAVYDYTGHTVGTVYCGGQGGDQGTRALVNNLYGGTFTNEAHTAYTWNSEENIAALRALYDCEGIDFAPGIVGGSEIFLFYNGDLNMAFCWNIAQQLNPNMSNTGIGLTANGDEILYMAFPSDSTPQLCGGVWGFGAFDNGDEARLNAAKAFISYMCDSDATADAVRTSGFFAVRDTAEGTDLSGIWADDAVRSEYAKLMPMMGDYYPVTPNWSDARTCWWQMLQDVGEGQDIETAANYWTAEANMESLPQISVIASGWSGDTTWTLTEDGVLTFSGNGNMKNYANKTAMPWYSYFDQITKVVIEEGVTRIGDCAFYGMPELTAIEIADTVTAIGQYTFKGCPKLDNVVLPAGLTKLGESAFYECTSLTSIEIPASLWTIQPYTFKNCTSLESVTFHEGNLLKISDGAFYGTALKEVTFPDCLGIIDVYAFKGCADLETIHLGSGITEIREAVFYGTAIPDITIPEGVTKIGPYAFKNCVNLRDVDLPESLTSVGEASFYACTALESIVLPDNVTSIGSYAFRKCTAMETVIFSDSLVTIGESSFYGCTGLTELAIPDSVTTIGGYAFKSCTAVTSVTLGDSVETIGDSAFHTCTSLKTIVFPASVETIGAYCFSGSYNLWRLTFKGDAPSIGTGAFKSLAATAYYPSSNATWTSDTMQNYGGNITWKAN